MRFYGSLALTFLAAAALPTLAQTTPAPTPDPSTASPTDAAGSTTAVREKAIPPAVDLMQMVGESFDLDGDGKISEPEFAEFSRLTWFSKDTNDDKVITEEEFKAWDFGFDYIAAEKGKDADFDQVKSDLFAYWDADGNGKITPEEIEAAAKAEFANSDTDQDGFVSGRDLAFGSPSFNAAIFAVGR